MLTDEAISKVVVWLLMLKTDAGLNLALSLFFNMFQFF